MRQLNGIYTQRFNRRHGRVGHVFQGRYKAIVVERDSYLKELALYVVLNPVRAKRVQHPGDWPWSKVKRTLERNYESHAKPGLSLRTTATTQICEEVVGEGQDQPVLMALLPEDRRVPALDCEVVRIKLSELQFHHPRQWGLLISLSGVGSVEI
jgi:hypothetical protein